MMVPFVGAGCGLLHRPPPQPPAVIIPQPPIVLNVPTPISPAAPPDVLAPLNALAPLPAFAMAMPPPPPRPPRRTVEIDANHARAEEPSQPPPAAEISAPPPQLTTNLSAEQQDAYRRNTLTILGRTESELNALYRRRLDDSAAATRAQAGEYVRQAQQALNQGDLVRAQTLAEKAETLARFLLNQ